VAITVLELCYCFSCWNSNIEPLRDHSIAEEFKASFGTNYLAVCRLMPMYTIASVAGLGDEFNVALFHEWTVRIMLLTVQLFVSNNGHQTIDASAISHAAGACQSAA
jgi:hypothetical protein